MDTSITHIRPRFRLEIPYNNEFITNRVKSMLAKDTPHIDGKLVNNHLILDIVGEEVHYWSPQLNFRIDKDELNPEHTILAGLIGPRPPVWTMFMFIYFGVGVIAFLISSYGFSKWMLGEFTYYLFAFPIAILFMLTAYKAGKYGESLGADQVEILKDFVREAAMLKRKNPE